ncbi:MAG: hypothetical protein M3R70_08635, partial [Actinomycetota bacterium]|nr:hypothetical protein [Actinomycetota bacterium]
MTRILLLATGLLLGAFSASAAEMRAGDSTRLAVNKQIGDIRRGETEANVIYDYGDDCIAGCPGRKDGCVLGISRCVGPTYRYAVESGYLRVGYRVVNYRGEERGNEPAALYVIQRPTPLLRVPNYRTAGTFPQVFSGDGAN